MMPRQYVTIQYDHLLRCRDKRAWNCPIRAAITEQLPNIQRCAVLPDWIQIQRQGDPEGQSADYRATTELRNWIERYDRWCGQQRLNRPPRPFTLELDPETETASVT